MNPLSNSDPSFCLLLSLLLLLLLLLLLFVVVIIVVVVIIFVVVIIIVAVIIFIVVVAAVVVVVAVVVAAVILLFLFRSKTSRCHSCLSDQSAFWYSMQLLLVLPPKLEPSKHISILIVWQADILKHAVSEQTSSIR